jgi:hypothetical protein
MLKYKRTAEASNEQAAGSSLPTDARAEKKRCVDATASPPLTPHRRELDEQKQRYTENIELLKAIVCESVNAIRKLKEEKLLRLQLEQKLLQATTELNAMRAERLRKGARKCL